MYSSPVPCKCYILYNYCSCCCCCLAAKSCLTLLPPHGISVRGISQERIVEWVAISFSRGSSWSRDWTCISCVGRQILHQWATRYSLTLKPGDWHWCRACVWFYDILSHIYFCNHQSNQDTELFHHSGLSCYPFIVTTVSLTP